MSISIGESIGNSVSPRRIISTYYESPSSTRLVVPKPRLSRHPFSQGVRLRSASVQGVFITGCVKVGKASEYLTVLYTDVQPVPPGSAWSPPPLPGAPGSSHTWAYLCLGSRSPWFLPRKIIGFHVLASAMLVAKPQYLLRIWWSLLMALVSKPIPFILCVSVFFL